MILCVVAEVMKTEVDQLLFVFFPAFLSAVSFLKNINFFFLKKVVKLQKEVGATSHFINSYTK